MKNFCIRYGLFAFLLLCTTWGKGQNTRAVLLKSEVRELVESRVEWALNINDKIFSFADTPWNEDSTVQYVKKILEGHGFAVDIGIGGIRTAWMARWGNGKPVIGLGSRTPGTPDQSQKPGIPYREPMVEGGAGMTEGNNSAIAMNILAAISAKSLMEKKQIAGTIVVWGGVGARELGSIQVLANQGAFDEFDASIYSESSGNFNTLSGLSIPASYSTHYQFRNRREAVNFVLDWKSGPKEFSGYGVDSMYLADSSTVRYQLHAFSTEQILQREELVRARAESAGASVKVAGSSLSGYSNNNISAALYYNIAQVGMPAWDKRDFILAKAVQKSSKSEFRPRGLLTRIHSRGSLVPEPPLDRFHPFGDLSWSVPSAIFYFPANVPGLNYSHWSGAVAAATPIAHKGVRAGAEALVLTLIDLLLNPNLIRAATDEFNELLLKGSPAQLISREDFSLDGRLTTSRETANQQAKYYHQGDSSYLDQLGIIYPTKLVAGNDPARKSQQRNGLLLGFGYGMGYSTHASTYEELENLLTTEFSGLRPMVLHARLGYGIDQQLAVYGTWQITPHRPRVSPYRSRYLGLATNYYFRRVKGFSMHAGFGKYSAEVENGFTAGEGTLFNLGIGLEFLTHLNGEINILTGSLSEGTVHPNPFVSKEFGLTFTINYLIY